MSNNEKMIMRGYFKTLENILVLLEFASCFIISISEIENFGKCSNKNLKKCIHFTDHGAAWSIKYPLDLICLAIIYHLKPHNFLQ